MALHPLAGKPAPRELLQNIPRLVAAYYTHEPDPENPAHQVAFGTSGHRGSSLKNSFTEKHILAISQAICDYRRSQGTDGPLFLGMDTHALSEPALVTAIEVFAGNEVDVVTQDGMGYTPTPAISHAILTRNHGRHTHLSDGVVITPSHNPPDDGGFKYNPPNGGPADTSVTKIIEQRANDLLRAGSERSQTAAVGAGQDGRHHLRIRLRNALRGRSEECGRHGGHRPGRSEDRRGPDGRRQPALLGAHRRDLRSRP